MEGANLMGDLYIQKPNGESIVMKQDGTEIRNEPIAIDWCDKCETWKPLEFGRHEKAEGLTILWFCQECK
jgi:hypothetical protein